MFFNYVVIAAGIVAGIIVVVAGIVVVVVSLLCLWLSIVPLLLSKVFLSQYKCVRVFWRLLSELYFGILGFPKSTSMSIHIFILIYLYIYILLFA